METFDAIIIGSGFGGAIPARRLAAQGRRVLVLEQGEALGPGDFRQEWSFRRQARLYTAYPTQDYQIMLRHGRGLGGSSLVYGGAHLRAPSAVFDYADKDGYRVWPGAVNRAILDPFYETVERTLPAARAQWAEVPGAGGALAALLDRMGLTCDRSVYALADCLGCGYCPAGCPFGRKRHLGLNYLPAATTAGADLRARCRADHLEREGSAYAVYYRDGHHLEQKAAAPLVLLAASALGTPALLLRSKPYLKGLHPRVGKNLHQNGAAALVFLLPEAGPPARSHMGRHHAGVVSYAFWEEHRITLHALTGPPAFFAALDLTRAGGRPEVPFGLEFKRLLKQYYPERMLLVQADGLTDAEGDVTLDAAGQARFSLPVTAGLQAYLDRAAGIGREIAGANGAELCRTGGDSLALGGDQPLGGCRMGDDGERAPCDANGELRGFPGLFCTDGAALPGGTGVGPAHTIAANAERIAAWLVQNR